MDNVSFSETGQWKLEKVIPNQIRPDQARIGDISNTYAAVKTKLLPNGLTYKMFKTNNRNDHPSKRIHVLYAPGNTEPVSLLETQHIRDEDSPDIMHRNAVNWSSTVQEHQGKGLIKQLYMAALMHLGEINSDQFMSPNAHKAWAGMSSTPGVNVKLANYGPKQFDRHNMKLDEKKPMNMNAIFHPVNL